MTSSQTKNGAKLLFFFDMCKFFCTFVVDFIHFK